MSIATSIELPLLQEASYYRPWHKKRLLCDLCAHECKIGEGKIGICGVRQNLHGKLYTLNYGRVVACQPALVEKIPIFHCRPGSQALSLATVGCNFHCSYCNNYDIAVISGHYGKQPETWGDALFPEEVVTLAGMLHCSSIAYTYTEPTIFFEYAYEAARLATLAGLRNIFGTNGYITEEPLHAVAPYLDAANVDLKSFREKTHRHVMGAKLQPVLNCLEMMKSLRIWVEVTTTVIPTINDSEAEIRDIAQFIKGLGPETPWHIMRFYPDFKLDDLPVTPAATLRRAREIALEEGLRYVYTNESPGNAGEHTHCHFCGEALVKRFSYEVTEINLKEGRCPVCATTMPGIDME